jgi:drug/metabolite transporter (DMT)-like permease
MYILVADKLLKENGDPLLLNFQQFSAVTVLSLVVILAFRLPVAVGNQQVWLSIGYLAFFATIIATGIQFTAQKKLSPSVTAILLSTESVFSAFFSWAIGHESLGKMQLFGGFIIFIAAVISQLPEKKLEPEDNT